MSAVESQNDAKTLWRALNTELQMCQGKIDTVKKRIEEAYKMLNLKSSVRANRISCLVARLETFAARKYVLAIRLASLENI